MFISVIARFDVDFEFDVTVEFPIVEWMVGCRS